MSTTAVESERQTCRSAAGDGKGIVGRNGPYAWGGTRADEAHGPTAPAAIDKADDQVEALFAPAVSNNQQAGA